MRAGCRTGGEGGLIPPGPIFVGSRGRSASPREQWLRCAATVSSRRLHSVTALPPLVTEQPRVKAFDRLGGCVVRREAGAVARSPRPVLRRVIRREAGCHHGVLGRRRQLELNTCRGCRWWGSWALMAPRGAAAIRPYSASVPWGLRGTRVGESKRTLDLRGLARGGKSRAVAGRRARVGDVPAPYCLDAAAFTGPGATPPAWPGITRVEGFVRASPAVGGGPRGLPAPGRANAAAGRWFARARPVSGREKCPLGRGRWRCPLRRAVMLPRALTAFPVWSAGVWLLARARASC